MRNEAGLQRRMIGRFSMGLAALAAIIARTRPAAAMKPPGTKGGPHYRESEHVKKFYQVNRY